MHKIKLLICLIVLISCLGTTKQAIAQANSQQEIEVSDNIKLYLLSTEFEQLRLFALDLQHFKELIKTLVSRAEKINLKLEVLIDNIDDANTQTQDTVLDTEQSTSTENITGDEKLSKQDLVNELNLIMQQLANVKEINNNFGINFTDLKINSRGDIIKEVERLQKIVRVVKENLVVIYNAQLNLLGKIEKIQNQ